ncbi:hypothetical protein OG339_47770 (plasmid) [Streptosporangium sp. NBC_01495]|uniref:hypothetical protein n=1 Tax=Streptosporangium sp. NBC_01495 TaxID=2903899 RepID=UPI002E374E5D|nr:hypothetical protein [Streptosporangium sp. NBC_01495]
MWLLRGGSYALVELEEKVRAAGGWVGRLSFHLDDLNIRVNAQPPREPYGTGLGPDRRGHAITARPPPRPVPALCGVMANPLLIGDWCLPFAADMTRTCGECARIVTSTPV